MKKIAITQRLVLNKDYYELRETLDVKWGELFKELDFIPVVLPYGFDFKYYEFDGVILSGGNDIEEFSLRDNFEFDLIQYCIERNIPILGVCRGMQILAKFFNGILKEVKNQVNIRHELQINQNSQYSPFLNRLKEVNSFHNYAVEGIMGNFLISATDKNNIIKAIEHKEYKILGQMWHSEREEPFNMDELNLIKSFFNNK